VHVVSLYLVLLSTWILLSGQFTPLHLGSGVVCSGLVTYLALRKGVADKEGHPVHLLTATLTYWPWLLSQILLANMDVIYRVWHPRLPISPCLLRVPRKTRTDLGTVIYANSITLTPGTVTVDVGEKNLLVHALTRAGGESLLDGEMQDRVRRLEYHT
jgi:multicomponent Na+:H+ antiporter subunit E